MLLRIGLSVRMFLRIGHDVSSRVSSDWFECTNVSSVWLFECTNVSSDCVLSVRMFLRIGLSVRMLLRIQIGHDVSSKVSSDWFECTCP